VPATVAHLRVMLSPAPVRGIRSNYGFGLVRVRTVTVP
jgi:hypothetical protein